MTHTLIADLIIDSLNLFTMNSMAVCAYLIKASSAFLLYAHSSGFHNFKVGKLHKNAALPKSKPNKKPAVWPRQAFYMTLRAVQVNCYTDQLLTGYGHYILQNSPSLECMV